MRRKAPKKVIVDSAPEAVGTGDEDRAKQSASHGITTVYGYKESTRTDWPTEVEAEEKEALSQSSYGMTNADLIDKWLSRVAGLRYVAFPFVIYGLSISSGHCNSWKEFGFASLASGVLIILLITVELFHKLGRWRNWW